MFGFRKKRIALPSFPSATSEKRLSDEEYNRLKQMYEAYAMALLEKIGRKGEKSLSKKEKAFLADYAKSGYLK